MNATVLRDALQKIVDANDYRKKYGSYPGLGPTDDFDDWAAEIARKAIAEAGS